MGVHLVLMRISANTHQNNVFLLFQIIFIFIFISDPRIKCKLPDRFISSTVEEGIFGSSRI